MNFSRCVLNGIVGPAGFEEEDRVAGFFPGLDFVGVATDADGEAPSREAEPPEAGTRNEEASSD